MAAPLRRTSLTFGTGYFKTLIKPNCKAAPSFLTNQTVLRNYSQKVDSSLLSSVKAKWSAGFLIVGASTGFVGWLTTKRSHADAEARRIARKMEGVIDIGNQKFTLYQYQPCPYCCKVRTALDFFGFPYDVVEVNSLSRKEIKFSEYRKVPILVIDGKTGEKDFTLQFNDSSVIVSVLASYMFDQRTTLKTLKTYYPVLKDEDGSGLKELIKIRQNWNFPNKYFIMFGENIADSRTEKQRREERQWRQWTDDILMHTISPNVYRTMKESKEAFQHFSVWGEWDENFSVTKSKAMVVAGSYVMYLVAKLVKRKYKIKDNPRESLYDACDQWMNAVGKNRFLGIDKPNLADLAVYGALHSFHGCQAFRDLMDFHSIKDWYQRVEEQVNTHQGALVLEELPVKQPIKY